MEAVCRMLVETKISLKEIASECGLISVDNMRRQFIKQLKITPLDYKRNFKSALN